MKIPTTNWTDVVLVDAVPLSEAVATINSKCPGAGYTETKLLEHAHNGQIVLFTRLVHVEATCPIRKIKAANILAEILQGMATKSGTDSFETNYCLNLEDVIFPPPYLPNNHTDRWIKTITNKISRFDIIGLEEDIATLRKWADQITLNGHVAIPPVTSGEFLCEDVVKLTTVFSYDAGFTRNTDGTKRHMDGSEFYFVNKTAKQESLRIDQKGINWIIERFKQLNGEQQTNEPRLKPNQTAQQKPHITYLIELIKNWDESKGGSLTASKAEKHIIEQIKSGNHSIPFELFGGFSLSIRGENREIQAFQNMFGKAKRLAGIPPREKRKNHVESRQIIK